MKKKLVSIDPVAANPSARDLSDQSHGFFFERACNCFMTLAQKFRLFSVAERGTGVDELAEHYTFV